MDSRGKTPANVTEFSVLCFLQVLQIEFWLSVNCDMLSQQQQPQQTRTMGPQASLKTQNTHSEALPPARQSACREDCVCHVQAETQQGDDVDFSLHRPLNPLIITDTHISLTFPPPLSSDTPAKPAIGLKSAKHNPAILLVSWPQRQLERGKNKGADRVFASRSGSVTRPPLVSERSSI